jgi:hypothetical protein
MQKTAIISTVIIVALSVSALAGAGREKALIYNLSIKKEKSVFVDKKKKQDEERFDYYSIIIPHTIAKHLNASGKIEAQQINGELPLEDIGSDEFYARMEAIGREHSAGYLIGGKGTIRGRKLTLELALINIRGKDFTAITRETFETGAEMRTIIADLCADIEQKLAATIQETRPAEKENLPVREETGPAEPDPVSPFLKMYRALGGLAFGVKTGHFFIKGAFANLYEDAEYISPYISFDILRWLGVAAEADYLAVDNGDIIVRKNSAMALWGSSLNLYGTYPLFKHFSVRLSAGFGVSVARLYLTSSDNPFSGITTQKKSVDPYLNVSASSVIHFMPVEIHFGGAYKSAFFKGNALSLLAIFFGIGYHL